MSDLCLAEVSDTWAEILVGAKCLERASITFAAHLRNIVAPPIEVGFGVLQAEEDNDARDSDATGPCGRQDKVVLNSGQSLVAIPNT